MGFTKKKTARFLLRKIRTPFSFRANKAAFICNPAEKQDYQRLGHYCTELALDHQGC